jgi:hypothetical protein
VAFGTPSRFDDPARFAFAHGGKDGHPHPVPLRVYDRTIESLRKALEQAKVERTEKMEAFRRLEQRARGWETTASGPDLEQLIDAEWNRGTELGGMTVMGSATQALQRIIARHAEAAGAHDSGATAIPRKRVTRRASSSSQPRQLRLFKV